MKNIKNLLSLSLIGLVLSCQQAPSSLNNSQEVLKTNLDGTITIQGRVLVAQTNEPPIGVNSIDITNRWVYSNKEKNLKGDNEKVYIDKNGYYRITIQKGDTIKLNTFQYLYKTNLPQYSLTNIESNSIINFTINTDSTVYKRIEKVSPEAKASLDQFIAEANPEKLVTIAGTVKDKSTHLPLTNLLITISYIQNSRGMALFHLSDEQGNFSITVPQKATLQFNPWSKTRYFEISSTKDTVVNILI